MRVPILTLAILDFRNTIRGIIPKKVVRYGVFGFIASFSILLSILMISLVLTNPESLKKIINVGNFAGMLLAMTGVALGFVIISASQDVENPNQLKIAFLSPQSETLQIIPRIIALIFIAMTPFIVIVIPFFLPVLLSNLFSGLFLISMIFFNLILSVLFSILIISILVKFLGRQRGSKISFNLASLLIPFSTIIFQKLISLKISMDFLGIFLLLNLLLIPILTFFILKQYRIALLNSKDLLSSKEPVWGQYPWSRFFWRSKAPWIILGFPVSVAMTLISPNGQSLIWKTIALFFTGIAIAYTMNELIAWNRDNPTLWNTSPNKFNVMKQLILQQFIPIMSISIIIIFILGITFHRLNWAIATTCLMPFQLAILSFRYGKLLLLISSSLSCAFIFLSPIFS